MNFHCTVGHVSKHTDDVHPASLRHVTPLGAPPTTTYTMLLLHRLCRLGGLLAGLDIMVWLLLASRHTLARAVPLHETTYPIDMSDAASVTHLSGVVDSLEGLGVLDESHANCYTVDRIVKSQDQFNPHSWKISVFVTEISTDQHSDSQTGDDRLSLNIACPTLRDAMHPDTETARNGTVSGVTNSTLMSDNQRNTTAVTPGATEDDNDGMYMQHDSI